MRRRRVTALLCLTTVASKRDAEKIAGRLVRNNLAASVQCLPGLISFYYWKKRFCRSREWLLVIKTVAPRLATLKWELLKLHPYELPEFVVLQISGGTVQYLKWLEESVRLR